MLFQLLARSPAARIYEPLFRSSVSSYRVLRYVLNRVCAADYIVGTELHSRLYWCYGLAHGGNVLQLQLADGLALLFVRPGVPEWRAGSLPLRLVGRGGQELTRPIIGWETPADSRVEVYSANRVAMMPAWLAPLAFLVLTALPWIRWRFTLRALLIATTLVAVVLGLIVAV